MANHRHDRTTGRFVSAAKNRTQKVQQLAEITDEDWTLDEEAMGILEAGMVLAVKDGWRPPDSAADTISAEVTP